MEVGWWDDGRSPDDVSGIRKGGDDEMLKKTIDLRDGRKNEE